MKSAAALKFTSSLENYVKNLRGRFTKDRKPVKGDNAFLIRPLQY
jgi:hypothetical protein